MSEQENKKIVRNNVSLEDFIQAVNNTEMKSINDVATFLKVKPMTVKSRMIKITKDYGWKLRKLPMSVGAQQRGLKNNPERLEALRALAERTYSEIQN